MRLSVGVTVLVLLFAACAHAEEGVTCETPPLSGSANNPLATCAMVQYDVAVPTGGKLEAMAAQDKRKVALDAFLAKHSSEVKLLDSERCRGAQLSFGCALALPKCLRVHTDDHLSALPPCRHTCRAFLDACVEPNTRYATELTVCGHLPDVGAACGHVPMLFTRPEAVEDLMYAGGETLMGVRVRYGVNNVVVQHVSGAMKASTKDGKVHIELAGAKLKATVDWWAASSMFDDTGRATAEAELDFEADLRVVTSPMMTFQAENVQSNPEIKLRVFDTPLEALKNYAINLFEKDVGSLTKKMMPDLVVKLVASQMSSQIAQFLSTNSKAEMSFSGNIAIDNHIDLHEEQWVDALALLSEGEETGVQSSSDDSAQVVATASTLARLVDANGHVTEVPLFE